MKSVLTGCIAMFILCNISLAQSMHQDHQAPTAPQHEHAFDWHGEPVQDPWYWLRDKDSPPVLDYLQAENAYTRSMTEGLAPFTDTLYQEMLGRLQQTDMDVPVRRGAWFYYSRTAAGQQYPIRCRRPASTAMSYDERAPEQVLLDLNEMAQGRAFISLGFMQVSDDGAWLVYAIDETGYRQYKLYRKSLASGKVEGPLAERVTRAQWATDNAMVFFTTEHPISKRSDSLWRLRSGGKPELIHEEKDELFRVDLGRSKDLKYLVLEVASADTWESSMLDASLPLTVGEYLEWGNPNEKPAFDYMRAYSPYDNLRKQAYPAILVTTSYNDSQVMYWEPTKYVAKLRTLKTDRNALLLKCKMDPAGHGGASGRYDALKDKAFEMAWMMQQVGITQ